MKLMNNLNSLFLSGFIIFFLSSCGGDSGGDGFVNPVRPDNELLSFDYLYIDDDYEWAQQTFFPGTIFATHATDNPDALSVFIVNQTFPDCASISDPSGYFDLVGSHVFYPDSLSAKVTFSYDFYSGEGGGWTILTPERYFGKVESINLDTNTVTGWVSWSSLEQGAGYKDEFSGWFEAMYCEDLSAVEFVINAALDAECHLDAGSDADLLDCP